MELLAWLAGVTAFLGAAGAFAKWVVRPVWRFFCKLQDFLNDWNGAEPRDGVEGRPGVMQRLERLDWHVGNGLDVPLRRVVDRTATDLHDHLVQADKDRRALHQVARHVGLDDIDGGDEGGSVKS